MVRPAHLLRHLDLITALRQEGRRTSSAGRVRRGPGVGPVSPRPQTGAATQADALTGWFLRRGSAPAARFGEAALEDDSLGSRQPLAHARLRERVRGCRFQWGRRGVWPTFLPGASEPRHKIRPCRGSKKMPGGCGSRPRDWGRPRPQQGRSRPACLFCTGHTRCSAGRRCSHQRQRAAQAGRAFCDEAGGPRITQRGDESKAITTPQVSAPLHVCLGASRHVLHRTDGAP
jgi:hypothetical protein